MKKFLSWATGIIAFVMAIYFGSQARKHKQRSDAITEREIEQLSNTKNQNLAKAEKLGKKAEKELDKAKQAKKNAEALAKTVEDSNAPTSLADRVRDFNNRL